MSGVDAFNRFLVVLNRDGKRDATDALATACASAATLLRWVASIGKGEAGRVALSRLVLTEIQGALRRQGVVLVFNVSALAEGSGT